MSVEITNKTKTKINLSLIKLVTERFLLFYKKKNWGVSIVLLGDKEIAKVNNKYRKINKPTDVLSFVEEDSKIFAQEKFLGEVLVDYQQIKRQAKEKKIKEKEEMVFILVHGLLHLMGYDDKTDKEAKKMEDLGIKFIKKIEKFL